MYDAYNPIYACPRAGLAHPRGLGVHTYTYYPYYYYDHNDRMMERGPEFRADTRSLYCMIGNVGVACGEDIGVGVAYW